MRHTDDLERNGFTILSSAVSDAEVERITAALRDALSTQLTDSASIQTRGGVVYAARNVLEFFPEAQDVWRKAELTSLLADVLGPACGLVRVLYFDKPPEQTWSLAWHRDQAIAVKDHQLPSDSFTNPTCKRDVSLFLVAVPFSNTGGFQAFLAANAPDRRDYPQHSRFHQSAYFP